MSTGGIIGAVVGGVAGFFLGGPLGAIYGVGMGFSLGMFVDPVKQDMPYLGAPDVDVNTMTSAIGDPLPDLIGTGKIVGHLLCYGDEHVEEITETVTTGKGGESSETYVKGYEYYMTWAVGICLGPIDSVLVIYKGEEVIWEGPLDCPSSGGVESIELEGMGECIFYFGTEDQVPSAVMENIIPDGEVTLNSPLRYVCWAILNDCKLGAINRTPSLSFLISRHPLISELGIFTSIGYDYNPAYAIWYVLHVVAGLPKEWLNADAFIILAEQLKEEYIGVSVLFASQQSVVSYVESINAHIDNILVYSTDGKFTPKLIRNDYDVDDIPLIDENVTIDKPTFTRKSWIDTVSEIKVQYNQLVNVEGLYTLYASGSNYYGLLLNSEAAGDSNYFELCDLVPFRIKSAHGGGACLFLISDKDDLWVIGAKQYGALGCGNQANGDPKTTIPVLTKILTNVKQVNSDSGSVTIALTLDNCVYTCGSNLYGQLGSGLEYNYEQSVFTKVYGPDPDILCVGCGYYYSFIGRTLNHLRCGYYNWGCGVSMDPEDQPDDPEIYSFESMTNPPVTCSYNINERAVVEFSSASGSRATFARDGGGNIWASGLDDMGKLLLHGAPAADTDIFAYVTPTSKKAIALEGNGWLLGNEGNLYGAGFNNYSELAQPYTEYFIDPFQLILPTQRFGFNLDHLVGEIQDIGCGTRYGLLLTEGGRIVGVGANNHGQLGMSGPTVQQTWVIEHYERKYSKLVACSGETSFALMRA